MSAFRKVISFACFYCCLVAVDPAFAVPVKDYKFSSFNNKTSLTFSAPGIGKQRFVFDSQRERLNATGSVDFLSDSIRESAAYTLLDGNLEIYFRKYNKKTERPVLYHLQIFDINDKDVNQSARLSRSPNLNKACGTEFYSTQRLAKPQVRTLYSPKRVLQISTDADVEYFARFGLKTFNKIRGIINAVNVLFLDQLGIELEIAEQHSFVSHSSALSSSSAASLLGGFRTYTLTNFHLGLPDIFHLFSGKKLKGSIIGLSYVGMTCKDLSTSFGLTQHVNPSIQVLVTAHEVGHILGATHPEDTLHAPEPSLMTGVVKESHDRFSEFSLNEIAASLAEGPDCFSATPQNNQQLDLGLSSEDQTLTISILDAWPSDLNNCTLALYYAFKRSNLFQGEGRLLANYTNSIDNFKVVTLPASGKKRSRVHFQSRLECPAGIQLESQIKSLYIKHSSKNQLKHALK